MNQFRQARDLLAMAKSGNDSSPQIDKVNVQVLTNEIAMGIAIAENQIAYEALAKELAAANQSGAAANSNQNANTNANVTRPR